MIIVRLIGGLGNQMFQYAVGRHLAHIHQTELKLDLHYLLDRRPRPNMVFRDFDLPIFNIQQNIATPKEVARFIGGYDSTWEAWKHRIRIRINPPNIAREKSHNFDPAILEQPNQTYLWGFWQSEKYFKAIEPIIREEFQFRNPLSIRSRELAQQIQNCNAVCINVRRTDFVNNSESSSSLGFTGLDYIYKAVDRLNNQVNNPVFFVFSDEIEWCRKNITIDATIKFIDHTYAGEKFHEYLHLMALCTYFIIPNSTFAWWAAWLNTNPDKVVIAPKKWFNHSNLNDNDLIPTTWHRI